MSDAGIKLGQLLCDADIITKRQLSKALQEQIKGKTGLPFEEIRFMY